MSKEIRNNLFGLPSSGMSGVNWAAYWAKKSAFFSGDFNFDTNKWEDKSPNGNHADLVGSYCVEILGDLTLTLATKRIGATITKVNDSADLTAGFAVNGSGDITIDFSELDVVANKVWNVFLSTGEEFRFTTGASPYVFAANNKGTLGGTETTHWQWSTTNLAHLNLKYGFSKYPVNNTESKPAILATTPPYTDSNGELNAWDVEWEGVFLDTNDLQYCFSTTAKKTTFYLYCQYTKSTGRVSFLAREAISNFYHDTTANLTKLKVKVAYNGKGYAVNDNWTLYVNDVLVNPTFADPSGANDRAALLSWAGNGRSSRVIAVRNYKLRYNGINFGYIRDGVFDNLQTYTKPNYYMYIPVFSGLDAFGFPPMNPAFINEWNYAETKIKMPVSAVLSDNDVNNILYTDPATPKELDLSNFYPSFGSKIHCNNGSINRVKDIIVTTTTTDLSNYLNGYRSDIILGILRTDTEGSNDLRSAKFDDLLYEENVKGEAHMFAPTFADKWGGLAVSGDMSVFMHDAVPSFYIYANYEEGKKAYDNATAEQKADGTVIENMGKIGYAYGAYSTPLQTFANYVTYFGFVYPTGVTPDPDDDNSMWWQWWVDEWERYLNGLGISLRGYTELGALPRGIHETHPDFISILELAVYGAATGVDLTDNLEGDESIFDAQLNASIVEDGGVNCQKLTGTGTVAQGNIGLNISEWMPHTVIDVSFMAKCTVTERPLSAIQFNQYNITNNILFAANITFLGVTYANPCVENTWYKVRLIVNDKYVVLALYNESDECILFTNKAVISETRIPIISLIINNGDTIIKNLRIKTYDTKKYIFVSNSVAFDGDTGANTADEWLEIVKKDFARRAIRDYYVARLFSHQIKDPAIKADDGTYTGVMDRSYLKIKEFVQFFKNSVRFVNAGLLINGDPRYSTTRRNLVLNGDFETEKFGLTGEAWGYAPLDIDAGESANSIDGTNILKLENGEAFSRAIRVKRAGWYYLRFYAKGSIRAGMLTHGSYSTFSNTLITPATYTFYEYPVYVNSDDTLLLFSLAAYATSYIHKLSVDERT